MKQGHLLTIFFAVYVICFLSLFLEQKKYDNVLMEKKKVEQALLKASYVAAKSYEKVINATDEIRKNTVADTFLESFYTAMGLFGTEQERMLLRMHLPLLILVEEDGAFIYFMQEMNSGENTELQHMWSEKIMCNVEENNMLDAIEQKMSEIVSNHNYIAEQYGISYLFHAPDFLQQDSYKITVPMLVVVFQGWPLSAAGDVFYENCIDAGVYIKEKERYTILLPYNLSEPFSVYHKSSCTLITEKNQFRCIKNITQDEAIQKYGAYPCRECIICE